MVSPIFHRMGDDATRRQKSSQKITDFKEIGGAERLIYTSRWSVEIS